MPAQEVVITSVALVGPVVSSMALWLRRRLELRGLREGQLLLAAAATLPAGSRVRVRCGDGTRVALTVGATRRNEDQR